MDSSKDRVPSCRLLPSSLRVLGSWVLLGFLLCGCVPTGEGDGTESGPEALVHAWVDMWNSYDLDRVPVLFLDDAGLTYFSSEVEGLIRGLQPVLEHHRGFGFVPGGVETGNRLWLEEIQVNEFPGAAVITAVWYFSSVSGAAEVPQRGPVTFVCVPREGG